MNLPTPTKFLFASILSLVLAFSLSGSISAVVSGEQNDFTKDVNEGKADLDTNPSAKADVKEVGSNETETANDEDNAAVDDKEVQDAPDQAEPATTPEESTDSGEGGTSTDSSGATN